MWLNKYNIRECLFLLFIFIIIDNLYTFLFSEIIVFISNNPYIFSGNEKEVNNSFLLIVFLVPFIETLFFQFFIIWFLYQTTENYKISILASALSFSLLHYFNIYYIIATFGSGLLLAILFVLAYKKSQNWAVSFLFTFLLHFEHNFIAYYY